MKKFFFSSLLLLSLAGSTLAESPMPLPETSRTIDFLEDTVLREFTFTEVDLFDICPGLEAITKLNDPSKKGLKFRMALDLQKELKKKPKLVSFKGINLMNMVNRLCLLYSITYSIENDTITFKRKP
jgi:hypothetical protein